MPIKRASPTVLACALAAALSFAILAAPAGAATRHIDGTVVSKSAGDRSFGLSTQSGTIRIRVNASTRFERIAGFGGLHKGLVVEVEAAQTSNGLLAKEVEVSGGGNGGGGDDNGGDDHGGHGGDDGSGHT